MKLKLVIPIVVALVIAAFVGGRFSHRAPSHDHPQSVPAGAEAKFWTCAMHPQIQKPGPGKCPICAMDLVPVFEDSGSGGDLAAREIKLSPAARKRAEIVTVPVERRFVTMNVRMVGKVEFDETRTGYISAWIPGRLDRLYVDYTGVEVKQGDHLADLYSPRLIEAQKTLLEAVSTSKQLRDSTSSTLHERSLVTGTSAREQLRLYGLSKEQIEAIEKAGQPQTHITINAPMSGVVVEKHAAEGLYVETGTRIYTIADLSHLWVKLDAYESDMTWIHYGQEVEFETEAYPGEIFTGKIAFIDRVLNPRTRTVKVRVNVPNPDGRLKPEMFVRAVVHSRVASGGKVMDSELAGKWISPMHPEIVKDQPGTCDICGMALVTAESLGYVSAENAGETAPLVIPASAPLVTGRRAVVYLADPKREGVFEGREIVLGPRAGNFYLVKSGLEAGELVVAHGAFKIDSAIQILAKPSMMAGEGARGKGLGTREVDWSSLGGAGSPPLSATPEFIDQLRTVVDASVKVGSALDHDQIPDRATVAELEKAVTHVDMKLLQHDAHMAWMKALEIISKGLKEMASAVDLKSSRQGFELVSYGLIQATERFGVRDGIFRFHCPMAFNNRGADWLQTVENIRNPYFGSSMLKCGKPVPEHPAGESPEKKPKGPSSGNEEVR